MKNRNIKVFTQGSYRNRVNVRRDSDVDIGALCFDSYFPGYDDDNIKAIVSKTEIDATYKYAAYKDEVEEALVAKFGRSNVKRGKKSFDIKENTYRVEADVAAFFEYRRHTSTTSYLSGVKMNPDDYNPPSIINWPEQHYQNGVSKNTKTSRMYKRIVRILKSLSIKMDSNGIHSAKNTPSFLIECLVWNAPNSSFKYSSYTETVRAVLAELFKSTMADSECSEWGEVSELKYLFRGSQPWSRQGAHFH